MEINLKSISQELFSLKKNIFIFTSSFLSLPVIDYFRANKEFSIKGICFLNDFFKKKNSLKQKIKNLVGEFNFNLMDNFYYRDPYLNDKKKILCYKNSLNFFFWNSNNELSIEDFIKSSNIDIIIVAGFKILKESTFSLAKEFSINIHPGILPANKGSSPVQWSIYLKKKYTGISIHKLSKKIDSGEIIYSEKFKLPFSLNCYEVERLINSYIPKTLANLFNKKKVKLIKQKERIYRNFNKEKSYINLNENFLKIESNLRALQPTTGLKFLYDKRVICIWEIKK